MPESMCIPACLGVTERQRSLTDGEGVEHSVTVWTPVYNRNRLPAAALHPSIEYRHTDILAVAFLHEFLSAPY